MSIDTKKLQALLQWYKQSVGENLVATLVVNREGLVIDALTDSEEESVDEEIIGGVSALVEPVLTRITKEFSSGSFGTGTFDTELLEEFLHAFTNNSGATLHVNLAYGSNTHHIIEAIFKALGRVLDQATSKDERIQGVLSTKGTL